MKKIFLFLSLIIVVVFISCGKKKEIPELLSGNFKEHIITFDDNNLRIDIESDYKKEILILLHHRKTEEEIKKYLKISDSLWNDKINILFGEGLIKKSENGLFLPTIFVLDEVNGKELKAFTDSLGAQLSVIAEDRLIKIKEETEKIPSLKKFSFNDISLFVLGAVVHDYWQLKYYQDYFIKSFVPHRGNNYFYMSLIQNENASLENPKLYSTKFYSFPQFMFGSFSLSNVEYNLATFPTSELNKSFGKEPQDGDSVFQVKLINELIKLSTNPNYNINIKHKDGFVRWGMIKENKLAIPVLSQNDFKDVYKIAEVIKDDIKSYFENRQPLFVKKYLNSQYKDETSYKEWMIWIYKMIAARAIDKLIEKSVIKTGSKPTASFIVEN